MVLAISWLSLTTFLDGHLCTQWLLNRKPSVVSKDFMFKLKSIQAHYNNCWRSRALRTDNGGEYISDEFKSYLQDLIIQHQLTVAYKPQQNRVAERMNWTPMDCVRSFLHTSKKEKKFWAEALSLAFISVIVSFRDRFRKMLPHTNAGWKVSRSFVLSHLWIQINDCTVCRWTTNRWK